NLLYLASVRRAALGAVIPMLALTPVFTALLSMFFLNEQLIPRQWVGIAVIVCASLVINGLPKFRGGGLGPTLMMAAAACWGAVSIFDKLSLRHSPVPEHMSLQ